MENISQNEEEEKKKISPIWIVVPIGIVVLLWIINLLSLVNFKDNIRGTFGDMFGASNALFSGLAFAGIIYTIALQRKELELQRKELMETKVALQRTAQAQIESEKALTEQVGSMKISARLSALTSVCNITMELIKVQNEGHLNMPLRNELNTNLNELKKILNELNK